MTIPSGPSPVKASAVPFEQLAGNPNISEKEKVKEAARQFEAVLLRQILADARKPVGVTGESDSSTSSGIYNDMINNQLADCISKSGSFGLAKSIENQLASQVLPKTLSPAQPGVKPTGQATDK